MRRWLTIGLVAVGFVAAWLLAPPGAIAADITNTAHDFTSTGPNATFQGAGSLCITCHTPHKSTQSVLLWNHTLSTTAMTFGNNATTTAGTTLPTNIGNWSGSTKLCLSCHDGTVNVGSLIVGTAWGNVAITNTAKIIGPNLAGNHPVAVPYPNPGTGAYNGITTAAVSTDYVPAATAGASIKLFADPTTAQKGIECASCHNPHKNATTDKKFLRVLHASLCTTCHVK